MVTGRAFSILLSLFVVAGILAWCLWKTGRIKLRTAVLVPAFVTCTAFILTLTVFERASGRKALYALQPFWSYKAIVEGSGYLIAENFWNVVLFVPFSFLLGLIFPKQKHWLWVLTGFLLSFAIELIQLVSHRGLCEFDDVFHNTLGALFGGLLLRMFLRQPLKRGLAAAGLALAVAAAAISWEAIHFTPEKRFTPPDVAGTALEKIVRGGYLRVYRPEYSCYVYQYENDLYWIADEDFAFEPDGTTYIQYRLWTVLADNKLQNRPDNAWYWENMGGYFEDYEITGDMDCGKYRVSRRELPAQNPVATVMTGYCLDDEWIWKNYFRPHYTFELKQSGG